MKRAARVGVAAAGEHLEMEVRAGRETGRAHVADGLSDAHARTATRSAGVVTEVCVARDDASRVADLDEVAVAPLPPGEDHDPVADAPHGRSGRGRVVDAAVLAPPSEDRMEAHPELARQAPVAQRRTQE